MVVVSDISRLGNSLAVVRDNICFLAERGVSFVSIRENYEFVRQDEFLSLLKGFDLVLDIRAWLASALTAKALHEKNRQGKSWDGLREQKSEKFSTARPMLFENAECGDVTGENRQQP